MKRRVWIMLPAFNEADSLPVLVPKIEEVMTRLGYAYRIVVVDDGSTDGTRGVIESLTGRGAPIDLVEHWINRGLGETERDGFEFISREASDDDVVIRLDCDDTHEPQYIEKLLARIDEGYDVVGTSRFQKSGGQMGVVGYRAFISYSANVFMAVMFNIPGVRDYSCGFRAYRASAIKDAVRVFGNYFLQLRGLGFTSTLETLIKLRLLGCRFAEVPFVLRYDQKRSPSKMVSSITTLGYFTMAILYHWPMGGWRSQYRGLSESWRKDRSTAVTTHSRLVRPIGAVSKVSL